MPISVLISILGIFIGTKTIINSESEIAEYPIETVTCSMDSETSLKIDRLLTESEGNSIAVPCPEEPSGYVFLWASVSEIESELSLAKTSNLPFEIQYQNDGYGNSLKELKALNEEVVTE